MKHLLKTIKRYQFSILIAFIIASTLYGIHMFRYEMITTNDGIGTVLKYDRITNSQCVLYDKQLDILMDVFINSEEVKLGKGGFTQDEIKEYFKDNKSTTQSKLIKLAKKAYSYCDESLFFHNRISELSLKKVRKYSD